LKTDVGVLAERAGRLEAKIERVDAKVDAVDRLLGARLDQPAAQAATNLQIVLAALQDKPG
jgi:hypothetical protein